MVGSWEDYSENDHRVVNLRSHEDPGDSSGVPRDLQ